MKDITLVTINWNNRLCLELMLKSYVKHHYNGEELNLLLIDNNSADDSREWMDTNGIPYQQLSGNIGHEAAICFLYPEIKTKYVLLVDTDILYNENVFSYIDLLNESTVAVGDLISGDRLGDMVIKPRLGAWFILFDIETCRNKGITYFRHPDNNNASYDVASEFYENLWRNNLGVHALKRLNDNPDSSVIGMQYEKFGHLLRMSWDLNKHVDREGEIMMRRRYVESRLNEFRDVDLRGKFI